MTSKIKMVMRALATVFAARTYWLIAAIAAVVFSVISFLVPVVMIPSNTLALTLSQMALKQYVALALFAIASGALVATNIYVLRRRQWAGAVGRGGIGTMISLAGGVFMTSCGCGVGFVVGIFGLGFSSVSYLVTYQFSITIIAFITVLIGLYFSAKAVVGVCEV